MNLNGIMIGSADASKLGEYYRKLFGDPNFEDSGFKGWQFGAGALVIGPHDQVRGENADPGRLMWNLEVADVRGEVERLTQAGAIVVKEPYQPAEGQEMWIATLADPDGNYFQLVSPM